MGLHINTDDDFLRRKRQKLYDMKSFMIIMIAVVCRHDGVGSCETARID